MTSPETPFDAQRFGMVERVTDGVAIFYAFANVGFVWGKGAALIVDTSSRRAGRRAVEALRAQTDEPLQHIVYTHGHLDHVGGVDAFIGDAQELGRPRPTVWAHESLPDRIERYRLTWGWNAEINRRQFGGAAGRAAAAPEIVPPDRTYRDTQEIDLAGERVELHHARGETDDATWVWLPERDVALVGDLVISSLPNTGNPNKTQRYTLGWAEALEAIASREPRWVLPGHGRALQGDLALEVLRETARALRYLHDAVIERLNAGRWPDDIVDEGLTLPDDLASRPYLSEIYGCVPFVVRDVLRFYAGWWGGNPAELLPAPRGVVARDVVDVAGRDEIYTQVGKLFAGGEARRALHLATLLVQAAPDDREARELQAELCEALAESETSFIARNFYRAAAQTAREAAE